MKIHRRIETRLAPALTASLESRSPSAATPRVKLLLEDAIAARSSDIHLDPHESEYCIRFRIDGTLHDVAAIEKDAGKRLLRYLRTNAEMDQPKPYQPQSGRVHMEIRDAPWEIRVSSAPCAFGEKMALRLLNRSLVERRISDLGMAAATLEEITAWTNGSTGMLVVVGPMGSGKTTTLYALVHELKVRQRSIVTIEDPVEYPIEGTTQMSVHEAHGMGFSEGLKSMLRLDGDYLLVGEIRDEESAKIAIDAAGVGRILMSTMHSRDTVGAVTMLRNYGAQDYEIAAALELVVAQRIVRRLCGKCKEHGPLDDREKRWLDREGIEHSGSSWHPVGCDGCSGTGFRDRLGVFEVWRLTDECEQSILEHADELRLRQILHAREHPFLLQDGLAKAAQGETTLGELQAMGTSSHGHPLRYQHRQRM